MKRYFNYFWAVSFVLFAVIMQSCSGDKADFTNLIPKDSEIVLNVNMNNLYEKGQFKDFEKSKLYSQLTGLLTIAAPEFKIAFDELVKNADNTGLELKSEMYLFKLKTSAGIIFPMKDKGKFEEYLKKLSAGSKEQPRKIENYLAVGDGKDVLIAWNDDVFYMLFEFEYADGKKLEDSFKAYIAQTKENSINANPYFATFSQNKKDVNVLVNLESSFSAANEIMAAAGNNLLNAMNFTKLMQGSNVGIFAEFNNGAIDYTLDYTLSDEVKKLANVDKMTNKSMSDRLLKVMPKDFVMAYTASLNPQELENYVKNITNKTLEDLKKADTQSNNIEQMKFMLDLYKQIVSKLDGEMAFAITGMSSGDNAFGSMDIPVPTIIAVLGAKSNTVLEELVNGELTKEGNYYVILPESPYRKLFAANANNMLMLTNNPEYLQNLEAGSIENNMAQCQFASNMKNNGLYCVANLDMNKMPLSFGDDIILELIRDKMDILDYADAKNVQATRMQGSLKFKEQKKNALVILMDKIESLLLGGF